MGKLIVELPDEIHGELKKRAAVDHKTLKNIITELIHEYLYTPDNHVSTKKTCLCGRWDDERTPEEIIKDIKTHRKWFIRRKK
ncbi:MAG: hypothetical protein AB1610_08735 [Nitrospirota bacterium]